jgi:hypothetical protein
MLSAELQRSLQQLLEATANEWIGRFAEEVRATRITMASKGMMRSGHHVGVLDRAGAQALYAAAIAMLEQVREVDGAQPSVRVDERVGAVTAEFLNEVVRLHRAVAATVTSQVKAMGLDPVRLGANAKADGALSAIQSTMPARIRTIITANANTALKGAAVTNNNLNLTLTDNMIGNVQTGAGSVGIATQTQYQTSVPEPVLKALVDVLQGIERADISERDRTELAEMVKELQSEVQKPAPNRRRLRSLLEVGADLATLGPAVSAAWTLVKDYVVPLFAS